MVAQIVKHSVLMVSFNHEPYIEEALQSILNQTVPPFEVVLVDDASTDGTWSIVEKFAPRFGPRMRAFRNESNIGLSQNIAKVKSLFKGNVISWCSGDDMLNSRTIELVNQAYEASGANPEDEKMLVVTNSEILWPDGHLTLWNNLIERDLGLIKTRLRGSLSCRSVGLSKSLFLSVRSEAEILNELPDCGLLADFIKGFEEIISASKVMYIDYAAGVYRYGVGVNSTAARKDIAIQKISALNHVIEKYGIKFDKSDFLYIELVVAQENIYIHGLDLRRFFYFLYLLIRNINNFGNNNPLYKSMGCLVPRGLFVPLKKLVRRFCHK